MSNAVYPTLPGLTFPVGRVIVPPPVIVRTTPSQREYRARDATLPRYRYSLPYEFLRHRAATPELAALVGFYVKHGGPFESWLFLDDDDGAVTSAPFGTGNGIAVSFQLTRAFGGFAEPVVDVVGTPTIYVNGAPTSAFSLSAGVVTFTAAPGGGAALTWTGSFYRRCRFLGDTMDTAKFMAGLFEAKKVEFISLKAGDQ